MPPIFNIIGQHWLPARFFLSRLFGCVRFVSTFALLISNCVTVITIKKIGSVFYGLVVYCTAHSYCCLDPKREKNQTLFGYTVTIIMSIFCHVMHGISRSLTPLTPAMRVCARTLFIIMRRQIGLRLKWFFFSLLFRKATHTQNLGKGQHTSTINRFGICEAMWLLLLFSSLKRIHFALFFPSPLRASLLLNEPIQKSTPIQRCVCALGLLFSSPLSMNLSPKKRSVCALFSQFVKFVLAFRYAVCAMHWTTPKWCIIGMGCPLCASQPTLRSCCWRWFGYWHRRLAHITCMFSSSSLSLAVTHRCLWVCLCLLLSISIYLPIDRSVVCLLAGSLRVSQSNNAWLSSLNCF